MDTGCYEIQDETASCPSDITGDGVTNGADLDPVLAFWSEQGKDLPGDLSGDNRVDGADLALILVGWGPCF